MIEWNVIRHNINKDEIEVFNIFKHGGFKDDVLTYFNNCENKDDFANKVNSSLLYYFWSRCEWEIIISPWVGKKDNTEIKVDVYWQVKNNWNVFIDYIWNYLSSKK